MRGVQDDNLSSGMTTTLLAAGIRSETLDKWVTSADSTHKEDHDGGKGGGGRAIAVRAHMIAPARDT